MQLILFKKNTNIFIIFLPLAYTIFKTENNFLQSTNNQPCILKKIKTLIVQFDNELPPKLVPAFRGAIIEKVNREHLLFHHHNGEKELLYKYPLIQYKSIGKKAGIICLGDGVGEMHRLFSQKDLKVKLHDKTIELDIAKLEINQFNFSFIKIEKAYQLVNWLGLNTENLKRYNELKSVIDKVTFLENIITANLLAMAKGIDWTIDEPIKVRILEVKDERIIRYKGNPLNAFDLVFETNLSIPYFIGLGKSVSHGYGMIKPINNKLHD